MNKYKQFVEETGQQLRYGSWLYHKKLTNHNNDFKKVCPKCKGFKKIPSPTESESGVIDCPECMGKPIQKS